MEGLLLLSALGILCVLFSFFTLELRDISEHAFAGDTVDAATTPAHVAFPPQVEAQVIGSQLSLVEVDDMGNALRTLYSSDLSDDIADLTLFDIPLSGYQGLIYVRPILDGNLPNLKVYPLDVNAGTLKAATLNVPSDEFLLSNDQTLVGVLSDDTLTLYTLEDGVAVATGEIPEDWNDLFVEGNATLTLSENSCLSLTSTLAPEDITPFLAVCP
ncbi:MAG: hypothetical protein AAB448_03315 [Patescibacteria group bacterium]